MKRFLAATALTGIVAALAPTAVATAAGPSLPLPGDSSSSSTSQDRSAWGRATAPDQDLRAGCRSYKFSYRVDSPTQEWMAEIFLVAPEGKRLAYVTYESAAQKPKADSTWKVCRPTTTPGLHTLRMKVTTYENGGSTSRWVEPTRFRLS